MLLSSAWAALAALISPSAVWTSRLIMGTASCSLHNSLFLVGICAILLLPLNVRRDGTVKSHFNSTSKISKMPVSAGSHHLRLASLITANLLLPIAVLVFAFGFFPYKPVLPGLSDFEDGRAVPSSGGPEERAPFDKVIFMVVDALRSDFVFGHESAMGYVQRYVGWKYLDALLGHRRLQTLGPNANSTPV